MANVKFKLMITSLPLRPRPDEAGARAGGAVIVNFFYHYFSGHELSFDALGVGQRCKLHVHEDGAEK